MGVGTGLSFGLVFGAHEPGARPALKVHEHLVRGTGTGTGIGRARSRARARGRGSPQGANAPEGHGGGRPPG